MFDNNIYLPPDFLSLMPLSEIVPTGIVIAFAANFRVIVPLSVACCAILIALPLAAARSRLHIPGYVGLAFLALVLGLVSGRVSGIRGVAGTSAGLFLSLAFFLFLAVVVGSVLALFFYRHPTQS
jgi:hypothetical protein